MGRGFLLTTFIALTLFYLQRQVKSPDREVDCLGIDSANLFWEKRQRNIRLKMDLPNDLGNKQYPVINMELFFNGIILRAKLEQSNTEQVHFLLF